jgi:hypothetical protein
MKYYSKVSPGDKQLGKAQLFRAIAAQVVLATG